MVLLMMFLKKKRRIESAKERIRDGTGSKEEEDRNIARYKALQDAIRNGKIKADELDKANRQRAEAEKLQKVKQAVQNLAAERLCSA
jgi:hypothetical protein